MGKTKGVIDRLTIERHDRDNVGMKYVYAVLSRRAGGVSIGINLNTNNACNWACVYCQVPGLVRGGPEPVDLGQLESELDSLLFELTGATAVNQALEAGSPIVDLAFSGNGEPTSAKEFADAVTLVGSLRERYGLQVPIRLITNGSLIRRPGVAAGITRIGELGGEVWFKIDRATPAETARINGVTRDPGRVVADLIRCARLAPTWVQTCWFADRAGEGDEDAFLALIDRVKGHIRGVHLYGLARPSCQPGAEQLRRLPAPELDRLGERIRALGLPISVSP